MNDFTPELARGADNEDDALIQLRLQEERDGVFVHGVYQGEVDKNAEAWTCLVRALRLYCRCHCCERNDLFACSCCNGCFRDGEVRDLEEVVAAANFRRMVQAAPASLLPGIQKRLCGCRMCMPGGCLAFVFQWISPWPSVCLLKME